MLLLELGVFLKLSTFK